MKYIVYTYCASSEQTMFYAGRSGWRTTAAAAKRYLKKSSALATAKRLRAEADDGWTVAISVDETGL